MTSACQPVPPTSLQDIKNGAIVIPPPRKLNLVLSESEHLALDHYNSDTRNNMCFPTPPIICLTPAWGCVINSDTSWGYPQVPHVKGSVPPACPLPQLQIPVTTPGCHLCFWSQVVTIPFLGSVNLLEGPRELREPFHFRVYWISIKGCNSENSQMEEVHRARNRKAHNARCPLGAARSLQPGGWTRPEALWTHPVGFSGGSINRLSWLNHWLNSISSPSPFPGKFPPFHHVVGSSGNQPPSFGDLGA